MSSKRLLALAGAASVGAALSAAPASARRRARRRARAALPHRRPTPQYWPINYDFPGLVAVRDDPAIFFVEDLLDAPTCAALIAKSAPHLRRSRVQSLGGYAADARRTSADARAAYGEVARIQRTFSELLAMPVSHFEPLKVSRYSEGEYFKQHHDSIARGCEHGCDYCPTPACNRVVTLFVYLNDCARGGETRFPPSRPLGVRTRRGLGVHFPEHDARGRGRPRTRVGHEGAAPRRVDLPAVGVDGPAGARGLPDSMCAAGGGAAPRHAAMIRGERPGRGVGGSRHGRARRRGSRVRFQKSTRPRGRVMWRPRQNTGGETATARVTASAAPMRTSSCGRRAARGVVSHG